MKILFNWFKNLSIKIKFLVLFLLFFIQISVMSITVYQTIDSLDRNADINLLLKETEKVSLEILQYQKEYIQTFSEYTLSRFTLKITELTHLTEKIQKYFPKLGDIKVMINATDEYITWYLGVAYHTKETVEVVNASKRMELLDSTRKLIDEKHEDYFSFLLKLNKNLRNKLAEHENVARNRIIIYFIITFLFIILVTILSYNFTGMTVFRPIINLSNFMGEFGGRKFELPDDIDQDDEIGKLYENFIKMAISIKSYNEDLEKLVEDRTIELKKANDKLKELDQLKSDFLSIVSHEIRTPLTSILGFSKIINKKLKKDVLPDISELDSNARKAVDKIEKNLDIIVAEGERLTNLVNDLLDISKMEAGKTQWDMEPIFIKDIIERAIVSTSSLFEEKKLDIINEIEEGLPEFIGDRDRLIQVIINLLSNAVKFTSQGHVECTAHMQDGEIIVRVSDTGAGIPGSDLDSIFEKFKQVRGAKGDIQKGTGLGLSISRQIIEHHGGEIRVESEVGRGSSFIFTLPVKDA